MELKFFEERSKDVAIKACSEPSQTSKMKKAFYESS